MEADKVFTTLFHEMFMPGTMAGERNCFHGREKALPWGDEDFKISYPFPFVWGGETTPPPSPPPSSLLLGGHTQASHFMHVGRRPFLRRTGSLTHTQGFPLLFCVPSYHRRRRPRMMIPKCNLQKALPSRSPPPPVCPKLSPPPFILQRRKRRGWRR